MAGASFKMDLSQMMAGVARAINTMGDTQPLMAAIGDALVTSTLERFEDGKCPDGQSWKPSKRAVAEGGLTLVDKGDLKKSFNGESKAYEATRTHVVVGTNVPYAGIHQFGGQAGRNHSVFLDPRPFLGVSEEDRQEIQGLMVEHLAQALGGGS